MGFRWSNESGLKQGDQGYIRIGSGDDPRMDYVGKDTESRMD